jgi:hypothetical protein
MTVASEKELPEGNNSPLHWKYLPLITEIWIFATLATFFAVRVLGSNTGRHLMHLFLGR